MRRLPCSSHALAVAGVRDRAAAGLDRALLELTCLHVGTAGPLAQALAQPTRHFSHDSNVTASGQPRRVTPRFHPLGVRRHGQGQRVAGRDRGAAAHDDDVAQRGLDVAVLLVLDGGAAEQGGAQQPARAGDADHLGGLLDVLAVVAGDGQVHLRPRCPRRPRPRWPCRPSGRPRRPPGGGRRPRCPRGGGPRRRAARPRPSRRPGSPRRTWPEASSTWSWRSSPGRGVSSRLPRSIRSASVLGEADLGDVPGAAARGARPGVSSDGGGLAGRGVSSDFLRRNISASPRWRRPESLRETAGGTVPARAAGRTGEALHLDEPGLLHLLDDQLGDPVAAGQVDRLPRVEVDQQHLDLAAVAGVDGPGRVDDRHPEPGGEPGARVHQGDVPVRQRDRDAGRHQRPLPRLEVHVDGRHQVGAGVTGVGVRRERDVRVGAGDQDLDAASGSVRACRRPYRRRAADRRVSGCARVSTSGWASRCAGGRSPRCSWPRCCWRSWSPPRRGSRWPGTALLRRRCWRRLRRLRRGAGLGARRRADRRAGPDLGRPRRRGAGAGRRRHPPPRRPRRRRPRLPAAAALPATRGPDRDRDPADPTPYWLVSTRRPTGWRPRSRTRAPTA